MKKTLLSPLFLIALGPLVLLAPIFATGRALFWGTPSTQFIPWWGFAWDSLLEGQLPLWNPWVGMGAPLAANYQSALFYPPHWAYLLAYAAGGLRLMAWSISLVVLGHLIWAGWGMSRLMADLGTGKLGQALSGVAFALSGYLVSRASFLSINATVAWLPWVLLSSKQIISSGKRAVWKTGLVIGLMLLAGHAQTAWYILLLDGLWMVYWVLEMAGGPHWIRKGAGFLAKFIGAALLGAALSAIQLLPTMEYLRESQRAGGYGLEKAMTYSFWPWRFFTYLAPNLFGSPAQGNYWGYGNYWEDAVYIGLVPFLLALGMIWRYIIARNVAQQSCAGKATTRLIVFLTAISGVAMLLALGKNTPVFPLLYQYVPTFDLFQAPTRFSIWAVFSLAVMAGMGLEDLKPPAGKALYWSRLAAAGCVAVSGAAGIAWYLLPGVRITLLAASGLAGLWGLAFALLRLNKPVDKASAKNAAWGSAVILLVSLDLVVASWGLLPGIGLDFYDPKTRPASGNRLMMPEELEYELKINQFFRFDSFLPDREWAELQEFMLPNTAMMRGIEMVNNFDPLLPGRYQSWMDSVNLMLGSQEPLDPDHQALRLMALGGIVQMGQDGQPAVKYLQRRELPRIWLAGCARYEEDERKILEQIFDQTANLDEGIMLEKARSDGYQDCSQNLTGTFQILHEGAGYLELKVKLDREGWVMWSQTWYPGWKVQLDGMPIVEVYRANYLFQAARVPAGQHVVVFFYQPLSFQAGGIISLAAAATIAIGLRKEKALINQQGKL